MIEMAIIHVGNVVLIAASFQWAITGVFTTFGGGDLTFVVAPFKCPSNAENRLELISSFRF